VKRLTMWLSRAILWIGLTGSLIAQDAQNEFVPAETLQRQELPSGPLLYAAYAFVWAAVLVYVFVLWRKLARVERELGEVNRKLGRR
jgi:CcmD family protein